MGESKQKSLVENLSFVPERPGVGVSGIIALGQMLVSCSPQPSLAVFIAEKVQFRCQFLVSPQAFAPVTRTLSAYQCSRLILSPLLMLVCIVMLLLVRGHSPRSFRVIPLGFLSISSVFLENTPNLVHCLLPFPGIREAAFAGEKSIF